ncbi:MAG: 4'-phosphopantetheinyl transferase superfamily protein [Clostridia bacterium]|nr:4'-phosphopantetheinyl transferase superfamily protein [Clostridia bacterium]
MNIGIDIVECGRVAGLVNEKIFSKHELEYIRKKNNALNTIAGLFAAKEAYFKAKGSGIVKSKLPEVEIGHYESGQPYYANDAQTSLSISHTDTIAVAVCIIF